MDVSYNLIESTKGPSLTMASRGKKRKLILDEFHLEYNNIKMLEPQSLQNFEAINKTYFDGNPITHIQVNTDFIFLNLVFRTIEICKKVLGH